VAAEQRNKVITKLHAILRPFVLRRLKSDVEINLPRKQEIILYAPMTQTQKHLNEQLRDGTLMVGGCGWESQGTWEMSQASQAVQQGKFAGPE
jgi:SNF2 family DNA or RNA helicase